MSRAEDWSCKVDLGVGHARFEIVEILAWIGSLVLARFDEPEEAGRNECAQAWSDPVDPMLVWKLAVCDAGAEAASWVERAPGVVDACA